MLTSEQILVLLERLKWEVLHKDGNHIFARLRGIGYSDDPTIARIEGALSIMLEVAHKSGR